MAAESLININVDALFEQHSVGEIDQIQKKLQTEIEKKREDLRTMVGERYRDLLKAADTIAVMKETSKSVIEQVKSINANCRSLNEKQLIGFKTESEIPYLSNRKLNSYFGTVVQIKLLTDLPEMIWTQIDNEKLFTAAQLFILSRHISTGLQLDANNGLMQYFPVAKKQWSILNPFFFIIKQNAFAILEREDISLELATDCLLGLFLLEKTSLDHILNNFVHLRAKAFVNTMLSDIEGKRRVKDRILAGMKVLCSTVELTFKCFVESDSGKGLLISNLEDLASKNAIPTIALMNLDDPALLSTLPDIIANFRPTFDIPILSNNAIKSVIETWMKNISSTANNELKELFELVSKISTIQEIRKQANSIEKSSKWNDMCERLSLPSQLDFYQYIYKPLINNRIRDIIRKSWSDAIIETHQEISDLLKSSDKSSQTEQCYLWTEDSSDIPNSLKEALQQDKKLNKLLMKAKGFNTKTVTICTSFDKRLEVIFSNVNLLLNEKDEKMDEKEALIDFLKDISHEQTLELITKTKSLSFVQNKDNFVLLARLLISFVDLCPNLKLCLSHAYVTSNWEKISTDKKNLEKWNKVCNLFEEEAFIFWKQFCEAFLEDCNIEKSMSSSIGLDMILKDFVNWETITIEENDEQDNPVQSTIRIPSQPRISLQMHFFRIIQTLNQTIPQTLPRKVLQYLNENLVKQFLKLYHNSVENEFIKTNQNIALQLYFDVRFLQIIFATRENQKAHEDFQKLALILKNFVDPFDFELFYSHLNDNIKRCAHRMQHELGAILLHPEHLGGVDVKHMKSSLDKDPNVLCLSSTGATATWFPLLPIVVPGSQKLNSIPTSTEPETQTSSLTSKSRKSDSKQSTSSVQPQTSQNYASNVKSGAAAFFGAMSQDWFR